MKGRRLLPARVQAPPRHRGFPRLTTLGHSDSQPRMPQIPLSLWEAEGLSVWPTNAETGTVQRQHPRLPRRCPVVTWGHASTGVGKNTSPFANNALSRRTSTEKL